MSLIKKIERPTLRNSLGFVKATFLLMVLSSASSAFAQQEQMEEVQNPATETEAVVFKDNLGRDTPRSTFIGFLKATEEFDYETAVQFMDLRNLPHAVRQVDRKELARQLDFVIQRGMKINVEQLSAKVSGQVVDGLPEYRDELGHLIGDDGEQVLYMQRVPGLDDNLSGKYPMPASRWYLNFMITSAIRPG